MQKKPLTKFNTPPFMIKTKSPEKTRNRIYMINLEENQKAFPLKSGKRQGIVSLHSPSVYCWNS
jgi:hypothetical protein